jgi:integrase
MATLYKRGTCYYLNWRDGGQQFRRSLGAVEKREAEALRTEKEAELRGLITVTRGVTVGAVLDGYLGWYRSARPTTYKRAVSAMRGFRQAHDHLAAESLPGTVIEKWAHAQAAQGTAEKAMKLARAAFRRAVAQRTLTLSPMDGVSIPKSLTSRAPPYFRREQLRKLARTQRGAAWVFMAATGIRRGEMVKARREDARDGVLLIESLATGRTKSGKWRAVPLNGYARWALRRLGEDRLVECHPDTLTDWFREDADAVGVKGTTHWLRHTFCTVLAQQAVSANDIKALAGHSSITVTEKYMHHAPSFGRSAVGTMGAWGRDKHTKKHTRP